MTESVELQIISKVLTCNDDDTIAKLLEFDSSYYAVFTKHIQFIQDHYSKYGDVPDTFTCLDRFPDLQLIDVSEPVEYLVTEIRKNKQTILLREAFNGLKDLGEADVTEAWDYLRNKCDEAEKLDECKPMNIISQAKERAATVVEFSKKARIPTGFPEIDKVMYGGLSTVEELCLILARTNSGKSWMCTKMMETAHKYKFPVAYYSPEMQSAYLATRFDTWRAHFKNSDLFQGKYDEEYNAYIENLSNDETPAFIIEDKDMMDGVTPRKLENFVKRNGIKELIIDGLSYMEDDKKSSSDYDKYKHICADLFKLSKKYGCAVIVCGQANRETKNQVDGKGLPFPTLYNFEGSDHPGRIATQAFALRQVFETHVLDIRLEKARMANNQNPVFSYSWDINTGNMQYIPGENNGDTSAPTNSMPKLVADPVATGPIISTNEGPASDIPLVNDSDDDIEF